MYPEAVLTVLSILYCHLELGLVFVCLLTSICQG